jgi:DNA mismatch repair protein MutS
MATHPKDIFAPPPDSVREGAAEPAARPDEVATPMMAQYLAIKRAHADYLVFYRMGDFYELFFDDAVKASAALDITLTKRGRHDGDDIPMCGVPVYAADAYLARLIRKGFRVAVCEQTEDPAEAKRRGAKSVVAREVIRIVTPGTLTEDSLLDARRNNYLAALAEVRGEHACAWLDISTGAFAVETLAPAGVVAALARIGPGEILVPERLAGEAALFGEFAAELTPQPNHRFDSEQARRRLETVFGVRALDGFGNFGRAELAACGALVDYVELTQKGRLPHLAPPRRVPQGAAMEIDTATRRNLEIVEPLSGAGATLLSAVDRTVTGAGGRLLAQRLTAPLTDVAAIRARHDMVAFFATDTDTRRDIRAALKGAPDLERALSRLTLGRGGPRDLGAMRSGLAAAGAIRGLLADAAATLPDGIAEARRDLDGHGPRVVELARALGPGLPMLVADGGFVAPGYSAELDAERALRDDSRRLIGALQSRYAAETGIASLKIRHNNVLGYFVEVTAVHAEKIAPPPGAPQAARDARFIHRQTLANAMRFTTVELGDLESRIGAAADKALALEKTIFEALVAGIAAAAEAVARTARALAGLDVAAAWAALAAECRHVRPVVDDGLAFEVAGGRHPVVEAALAAARTGSFVANDCDLAPDARLWLVTGPNMAGKSTFLRQNALIAILAQAGAFVPADRARIGVVDRLFSRVGAADDLARGRSTFMVEMVETAAILNQAGERALVILDEIGRGTATFDGLSIAWAALEHLHEVNRCRALFATHFHELTSLTARLPALRCHTMRVKEWKGDVVFLHEVGPGAADRSYGIHVAKLAGLPPAVLARAEEVLETLESGEQSGALARLAEDLPLFSAAVARARPAARSAVEAALAEINPDDLTPKSALEALYKLKDLLRGAT